VTIILLLGLVLIGAAVALFARATAMARTRSTETLSTIQSYGFAVPKAEEPAPRGLRPMIDGIANQLGRIFGGRMGGFREAKLRELLTAAGMYTTTPRKFTGYRVLAAVSVPVVWMWSASAAGFPAALTMLGLVCTVLVGWMAPMSVVRRRTLRRFEQIDYELPELIDQLVVTVEAGLGFNGSLQLAAEHAHGPLADELRLTLQQQSMGLTTNEALGNMLVRCDTPLMRSFVRSVLQGETLGVSIGKIMRDLATEMRKRRRQAAEEKAQKAPIKILFPLVFLIFPSMFLILLGPAVFSFLNTLG
jgi:tight adherence protein C